MQGVGAALGDHVDVAAQRAAELRLPAGGDDLKFVDHVQTVERPVESGRIVVGGQSVDDEAVGEIALAADGNTLAGDGRGLGEKLIGGGVGGRHAGDQQGEIEKIAPVDRQVVDLGLRHRSGDLAAGRFEDGGFGVRGYGFSGTWR